MEPLIDFLGLDKFTSNIRILPYEILTNFYKYWIRDITWRPKYELNEGFRNSLMDSGITHSKNNRRFMPHNLLYKHLWF
jgi:hypothetical protein